MMQPQSSVPNSDNAQPDQNASSATTPPTPNANFLNSTRERIEASPPGLMLAAYRTKVIEDDYILTMQQQLMTAGSKTGVSMPTVKHLHGLYSGTRDAQRAKALAAMDTLPETAVPRTVHAFGSRSGFDFASEEGLYTLRTFIEQHGECAITAKAALCADDPCLGERLMRIDIAAQKAHSYVMLFVDLSDTTTEIQLQRFSDECFEADICEANPDARISFSIAAARLAHLHRYGIGKVLVSVNWTADGYIRKYQSFVSASVKHRLAWMLAGSKQSYEAIGQRFGVNKTTIMRWMRKMPPVRSKPIDDELIGRYMEAIDLAEMRDTDVTAQGLDDDDLIDGVE